MDINEQVDMICLPTELQQATSPGSQNFTKRFLQVRQQFWRQCLAAVLCHKYNM